MNNIGYWNKTKEKLKQKYPVLTNEDVCFTEGKEKVMIERIEYKLGKSKDELRSILTRL